MAHGQIQVIIGPMFSGKSTELCRRIDRYKYANKLCVLIKYEKDNRYNNNEECVICHDGKKYKKAIPTTQLNNIRDQVLNFDVIGIDEGQFFPDVVEFSENMAALNKIVIVAGLDGDYLRNPFGHIIELIPKAENVVKLNSICMVCYDKASFSKRLCSGTQTEIIGGKERYMPVCRNCYLK